MSRGIKVTSGVPQGSHLGPILFLLFINDVTSVFKKCKCLLLCDDLKMYCTVESLQDRLIIQKELKNLVKWCDKNLLQVNILKGKVMSFYKCKNPVMCQYFTQNEIMEIVQSFTDLGVVFSSDLGFNKNIESIVL